MKIAVLTSSRADYGIYLPLLRKLADDADFDLRIIAFGTHLSKKHGYTLTQIQNDGFRCLDLVKTPVRGDTPSEISTAMGDVFHAFARYWPNTKFDLVFALGDRFEMFAAVASSVPFNIKIAHIHGGETTTGAIDDAFRHAITHMSALHFTCAEPYRRRVIQMTGKNTNVFNTGALSLDNLRSLKLLTKEEFLLKYGVDLNQPTILITFHPETVSYQNNLHHINEVIQALKAIKDYQFVITMPNADTMGNTLREKLKEFIGSDKRAFGFESLGTLGYLSCMHWCTMMLGNTSSGFTEASFFSKPVINLGNRQQGRLLTANILNCEISKEQILDAVQKAGSMKASKRSRIYGNGRAAESIIDIIKKINTNNG